MRRGIPARRQDSPFLGVPVNVNSGGSNLNANLEARLDLAGCIAGRKDAWDAFVRATAGLVHGTVRRAIAARGGSPAEVDDRVQDVYVRLLQRDAKLLRQFDPGRASIATWLTIIARTVVHESQRRKRLPIVPLTDGSDIPTEVDQSTGADLPDLPWSVISEQQRQVLILLFDEGCSVEEAAARLGVAPQTIRSAKHKALERFRTEFRRGQSGDHPDARIRGDADGRRHLYPHEDRHANRQADIS